MKDYIYENIYNNAFTPDDVLNGKTGFMYWDSLQQKERAKLMAKYRKKMAMMTPQERAKLIDQFQAEVRKKQRADGGRLKNASSYDVVREMINVDVPRIKKEIIAIEEKLGRLDIVQDLRRRKLGVDTFSIEFNTDE